MTVSFPGKTMLLEVSQTLEVMTYANNIFYSGKIVEDVAERIIYEVG
jgi:hypothetical protein